MSTLIEKQAAEREKSVKRLVDILSKGEFYTVKHLTELFWCSKPTIYEHLKLLKLRGYKLKRRRSREHSPGPAAWAYTIVEVPK